MEFTKEQLDWMNCIKARIIPLVKEGVEIEAAMKIAMEQHAAFLQEMAVGTSNRATAARKALCAKVWHDSNCRELARKTMAFVSN